MAAVARRTTSKVVNLKTKTKPVAKRVVRKKPEPTAKISHTVELSKVKTFAGLVKAIEQAEDAGCPDSAKVSYQSGGYHYNGAYAGAIVSLTWTD